MQNFTVRVTAGEAGPGLGTRMRHVLELLDGDVARVYADLGLPEYRPRFSPVVRALIALGPSSIRDLARAVAVTHSAASQTVAQMSRSGLVTVGPGRDARQRIVRLTHKARTLLPVIEAEWGATQEAADDLEAELPVPLGKVLTAIERAVARRPMRERIARAAGRQHAAARERGRDPGDPVLTALLAIADQDGDRARGSYPGRDRADRHESER